MALKTIEGYSDIDFKFDPIENADYSENNVKQDYKIISGSYTNASKIMKVFFELCGYINRQLTSISETGISSRHLDSTFATIKDYLQDAKENVEMNNKVFTSLVDEELEEILLSNKASVQRLETVTKYGDTSSNTNQTDHAKKARDYFNSVLGNVTNGVSDITRKDGNPMNGVIDFSRNDGNMKIGPNWGKKTSDEGLVNMTNSSSNDTVGKGLGEGNRVRDIINNVEIKPIGENSTNGNQYYEVPGLKSDITNNPDIKRIDNKISNQENLYYDIPKIKDNTDGFNTGFLDSGVNNRPNNGNIYYETTGFQGAQTNPIGLSLEDAMRNSNIERLNNNRNTMIKY